MERLSARTQLHDLIESPVYDRQALKPGIVHIGLGAFHRAHQAIYTDAALAHAFGNWGIVGVSLRSTEIAQDMRAQDCLYSVVARDRSGDSVRVVGSIVEALAANDDGEAVLGRLADPAIQIVTLTVSEKAYGIDPISGGLDYAHPAIAEDLKSPTRPTGVIGYLTEGLARRKAAGLPPFTVLCCDNLPSNGRIVRRLVIEMAATRDPALAEWISETVSFPCSMVDRIVPAATAETRARAEKLLGVEDRLSIEAETFSQWVIEDDFVGDRPTWDAGGALFVENVEPYEKMKLRLLNGSHSLIAYLGQLQKLEFVRDVMAVPENVVLVRRHMQAAVRTLDPVPGIDLTHYMDQLVERFANPAIAHRTQQIAMDGSQKLPQRLFQPAVDAISSGSDAAEFAFVTAVWIAYLKQAETIDDPRAQELQKAVADAMLADETASFFAIAGLFPSELQANRAWRNQVNSLLRSL
ncbi:mannitol dehydrogenase family protein [Agrobacterium sp. SHOUNA12C]|uniref:Mannonate oxidoreductase n=2 Tax=Rhizobium rhizogenes TaxID=359 RepID=A0AA87Q8A8_RHIRH|nr:mannitol dehydrogenase family protein [Rhizobium rhizogenes]KAA6483042.1 mannitol dehydrogenase family protein [Agrobacterium sp. ICMP 7243]MCJ9721500.1 mannitol dehydrogenase family protein [Agrobacterium sp. BETTINA12B]MCJ9756130.1 mannitol dehydrogenase family protein [Agrobacterium sp. SHOUNA12C]NTF58387.1 mannitol dehydrogenase family protein [Rhizobium rhizogenes]NTF64799.1 mannitol dehydrogenase family protein [Rhizobium rhizogenes]